MCPLRYRLLGHPPSQYPISSVSHQVNSMVIWQAECPGASNKGEEYLLWPCSD